MSESMRALARKRWEGVPARERERIARNMALARWYAVPAWERSEHGRDMALARWAFYLTRHAEGWDVRMRKIVVRILNGIDAQRCDLLGRFENLDGRRKELLWMLGDVDDPETLA